MTNNSSQITAMDVNLVITKIHRANLPVLDAPHPSIFFVQKFLEVLINEQKL
jgi:hypothetical protein